MAELTPDQQAKRRANKARTYQKHRAHIIALSARNQRAQQLADPAGFRAQKNRQYRERKDRFAMLAFPVINAMVKQGRDWREIAATLNRIGIPRYEPGPWSPCLARNVHRFGLAYTSD